MSAEVFKWDDREVEWMGFYNSIMNFLENPEEEEEVSNLLWFWNQYASVTPVVGGFNMLIDNRQVFPTYSTSKIHITKSSALV